jgi:hypothetical protein
MLELQALAAEDGWAFVKSGNKTLLVRPPYERAQMVEVTADAVARAIGAHGFQAASQVFTDWDQLIGHLRSELVRTNRERPTVDRPVRRLLQLAPREIIERYLDRVAQELIPQGHWSSAIEVVEELLELDRVIADAELRRRASDLLKAAVAGFRRQNEARMTLASQAADIVGRFPRTSRRYGERPVQNYLEKVRRHRVLTMAS